MPFLYRLSSQQTLLAKQLHHALQLIVTKHPSLRSSFIFDAGNNQLIQQIIDLNDSNNELFTFTESVYETEMNNSMLYSTTRNTILNILILFMDSSFDAI